MTRVVIILGCIFMALQCGAAAESPAAHVKTQSALYPADVRGQARANASAHAWAAAVRDDLTTAAQPWRDMSDDALWALMFSPTIERSWMVWSNGQCPACGQDVPMYTWKMSALERPWKVQCPHCGEFFPKNDFGAFYESGLDAQRIFRPEKADRALLFNTEHPDAADPLRLFGVDDGDGYAEGEKRWRFIGAYLIYGQWKQAVLGGIRVLAAAHLLTGDPEYARKAAILLDRVADVYPDFDYAAQGYVYEKKISRGYVSVWHDACEETRELVMAYDMIFEAIQQDAALVAFLSDKAAAHGLANPKRSFTDIQRNIEDRILRDAITNRPKITSNYPRTEIAVAVIHAVLGGPEHMAAFDQEVNGMLAKATAVDGVTGEKGLAGYASYTIQALAMFLAEFDKMDSGFLPEMLRRCPRLRETFRFHIDTQCLGRYYPQSGDSGAFGAPSADYIGVILQKPGYHGVGASRWTHAPPSPYAFMGRMTELTGDPAYVQIAWRDNGRSLDGLPHDLYVKDAAAAQAAFAAVIDTYGSDVRLESVNKQEWRIAILRSGVEQNARAVWLDYDSGGGHGHNDALNLGLFAHGLDLMPEFGYPPVQYGGWDSPRARWYLMSAAHNTVVVDGKNSAPGGGNTTLWRVGNNFKVMRADAAACNQERRFERTVALVDVPPDAFYVVDLFRVEGGADHTLFMHSHFGEAQAEGLTLRDAPDYGHGSIMRNVRMDDAPVPGWHVEWRVEDRRKLLPEPADIRVRYTSLTPDCAAGLAEAWISPGLYNATEEVWIPRMLARRRGDAAAALASTFAGVIQAYSGAPTAQAVERLTLCNATGETLSDAHLAVRITLADGTQDIFIARDPAILPPGEQVGIPERQIQTDADCCLLRYDAKKNVAYAALCQGSYLRAGSYQLALPAMTAFYEIAAETAD